MRRWSGAVLSALLGLSVLVAACGGSGGSDTAPITWQVWADPEEAEVYQAIIDAYATANPGAEVTLNAIPDRKTFLSRLSASFASGSPPDVYLVNYRHNGQFATKGVLEPLGPKLEKAKGLSADQFFDVPMQAFTVDGVLQCIPFNQSSLVVYYNKDLFEQHGVALPANDWTWDDFVAAAKALTLDNNGDGKTDVWGLGFEPSIIRAAPFIWSHGGSLLADPGDPRSVTFGGEATREALQYFIDLNLVHNVVPDEAAYAAQDPDSRFMDGSIAMVLNSRRSTPVFRAIDGFEWDVAPPPADVTQASTLHSDAFCIPKDAKNKDAAWKFVEYAIGKDGQTVAAKLGRTVPSLKSVAESDAFLDPGKPPANSQIFLDLGPSLVSLPTIPEWPEIEKVINEELYVAFFGTKSLDDALKTAEDKTREILGR